MWMATRYNTVEQAALVHRHNAQEPKGGTRFVAACSAEGSVLHFPNHGDVVFTQYMEPIVMGQCSIRFSQFSRGLEAMVLIVGPNCCTERALWQLGE